MENQSESTLDSGKEVVESVAPYNKQKIIIIFESLAIFVLLISLFYLIKRPQRFEPAVSVISEEVYDDSVADVKEEVGKETEVDKVLQSINESVSSLDFTQKVTNSDQIVFSHYKEDKISPETEVVYSLKKGYKSIKNYNIGLYSDEPEKILTHLEDIGFTKAFDVPYTGGGSRYDLFNSNQNLACILEWGWDIQYVDAYEAYLGLDRGDFINYIEIFPHYLEVSCGELE